MTLLYSLDLLGIAAFAASGALAGIRRDMDIFGVLVLGLVTATGGGTIRDVLSTQVPMVLQKEVYASACLAGGILLYLLHLTTLPRNWTFSIAALTVTVLRLLAIHYNWSLPRAYGNTSSLGR